MIYRRGNHFGHVTQMPGINFCSPTHKNLALVCQAVLEEKLFEMLDGQTEGSRRMPDHG